MSSPIYRSGLESEILLAMSTLLRAICAASLVALGACSSEAQSPRQPGGSDVVATVGGRSITLSEVDLRALKQVAGNFGSLTLAQALYEARRGAIEELVGDALVDMEAKATGVDRAALLKREIEDRVVSPTELDIAAWYTANPQRVQGAPLEKVAAPIRAVLLEERTREAQGRYLDSLKAKTAIAISLDPPRLKVSDAGRPSRGPANAPVEIIEFSDFQCPFCLQAHPTVAKVLSAYGDRIRFVYRHFPLPNHPAARPAAEASACADEQGKFWQYHDRLFDNQTRLSDADLKGHAAALEMDAAKFNACVDSHKYANVVDEDVTAGEDAGVSGTPAFFINGRVLGGAQPFEAFKRVIDEELSRKP
jgi:protein-disulfide isomerase